jgi:hypothetical protein
MLLFQTLLLVLLVLLLLLLLLFLLLLLLFLLLSFRLNLAKYNERRLQRPREISGKRNIFLSGVNFIKILQAAFGSVNLQCSHWHKA